MPSNTTMSRLFFFASSIRALTILSDETLLSSGLWEAGLFWGAGVSSRRTSEESTVADAAGGAEEDAHRPICKLVCTAEIDFGNRKIEKMTMLGEIVTPIRFLGRYYGEAI